ncbi:MAG: hypothetical protein K2X93_15730 [Candidatus Obscuribacterales bacterium]|nr:hypothetical protein [Candidatus Obscuribacterales bacterium]
MKLLHRCIAFLVAVFVFQSAIFLVVLKEFSESQAKVDEARHSVVISQKVVALQRGIQDWMSNFVLSIGTGKSPVDDEYLKKTKTLIDEFESIAGEVKKNSEDYKYIELSRKGFDYVRNEVETMGKSIHDGNYDLSVLYLFKNESTKGLRGHLHDTLEFLFHVTEHHSLKSDKLKELDRDREIKFLYLIGGMFFLNFTGLTIAVLGFNRTVSRRIEILIDNFLRFGKREPLNPPETGKDEITTLDESFRTLVQDLEDSTEKDRAMFAYMPSGLIACGENGRIESINPTALVMIGCENPQSLVANISDLLVAKDSSAQDTVRTDTIPKNGGYHLIRSDSGMLPVELTSSKFILKGEKKFLIALVDVSAREEIERMKQEFLSMVSHDLQTPLTSIGVCLEMLRLQIPEDVSETAQKYLHIAQGESARLIRLTRDILDLAKADTGQVVLHKQFTSTEAIVEQSIGAVIHLAEKKEIEIVESSQDRDINCDPDKISQILVNFLSNAIKYSDSHSQIRVVTEVANERCRFSVIDQGRGIPPTSIDHVFDRFKQVYDKDSKVGTGLGLAICKILAEAHAGSVGVESVEGQGSTFWLEIPMNSPATELTPPLV